MVDGFGRARAVDDALAAVASREPLLVLGPRGLDDEPLMDALDGSVLRVDLGVNRPLSAPLAAQLFTPRRETRVVFRETRRGGPGRCWDTYMERVRILRLMPLAARPDEVARLLQMIWRDELGSDLGVEELGARALEGLAAYRWPGQIDELRAHAPRLLAYHRCGGLRAAARALGVTHQTLGGHLNRVGVPIRDQVDRELPLVRRSRA